MEKAEAKREVARLVSKLDSLTKPEFKKYDEANTKKDFIEPLFSALGWATKDRREVTAEDKVSRRRVDYAFRIEGIPKFFLEAKPLKADLDNPKYAWQAINYAWTKGVTWAVLTDFEGLKVFNAQWKGTNLLYNRFLDIPYTEYLERFDELWLLSRQSFEKGLLDIEAEKVAKKAKREPVGKQLFDDLILWRQRLYRQLRGWNKEYFEAQIDEAVQRILDRLIFIRTAEDRELEERVLIPAVREWRENGRRKELDEALVRIFRQFDEKYDSELFEVGHFCEKLACDSSTYASVIEGLYGMRDEVPTYNFDAIDVDVLGGIYEQYLSYRQGLPEEVEEAKRRRRKKRGIYYTPKFVVKYIVENTVGRLLQERSHDEIRKLRILDPACGSGSFLIEAFDCLDRYHQEARGTAQRSDEKAARDDFLERLRILKDNIYGVDLDPQAVEIARLNLLLKTLYQRALLPRLENNIRCGNSLISGMPIELSQYFGADWEAKRPFNWEEEFPKIMEEGGFDVIIGNPPWGGELTEQDLEYAKVCYCEVSSGGIDTFKLFLQRGVEKLRGGGLLGYVIPNTFLTQTTYHDLRRYLLRLEILNIVNLGENLFPGATNPCCAIIVRKSPPSGDSRVWCLDLASLHTSEEKQGALTTSKIPPTSVRQSYYNETPFNNFYLQDQSQLLGRLRRFSELGDVIHFRIKDVGINYNRSSVSRKVFYRGKQENPEDPNFIKSGHIVRYGLKSSDHYLRANYSELLGEGEKISFNATVFTSPRKLVFRQTADCPIVALDTHQLYLGRSVIAIIETPEGTEEPVESLEFLMGLLNSRLIRWYYQDLTREAGRTFAQVKVRNMKALPIRRIDFDNPDDVKMHDDLVALVERMLGLHKRLKEAKGEEKKNLERQIARTDRKIDDLVYQLYGITEEDRKIIEEKTSP